MPKKSAAPQPVVAVPESKCYITTGTLPSEDETRKRPYSTVLSHPFNQKIDIILPTEVYELVKDELFSKVENVVYHRIFMSMGKILERDFYNRYIRQGNILLLSDGRIDTDDVFCLYDGILHLSLRKDTYEKAGLVGKPARFGGSHGRARDRWIVEYNLRASHMVHGKKLFKRVEWSCEKVFNNNQSWLFCDLNQSKYPILFHLSVNQYYSELTFDVEAVKADTLEETPLTSLPSISVPTKPIISTCIVTTNSSPVHIPTLHPTTPPADLQLDLSSEYHKQVFLDWVLDLHEWLALASQPADRLSVHDSVDPLLSRYSVNSEEARNQTGQITKLQWNGFLPAEWVNTLLLSLIELTPRDSWSSLTLFGFANSPISWKQRQHSTIAGGFSGENLATIMRLPHADYEPSLIVATKDVVEIMDEGMEVDSNSQEVERPSKVGLKLHYICWEVIGGRDEHS